MLWIWFFWLKISICENSQLRAISTLQRLAGHQSVGSSRCLCVASSRLLSTYTRPFECHHLPVSRGGLDGLSCDFHHPSAAAAFPHMSLVLGVTETSPSGSPQGGYISKSLLVSSHSWRKELATELLPPDQDHTMPGRRRGASGVKKPWNADLKECAISFCLYKFYYFSTIVDIHHCTGFSVPQQLDVYMTYEVVAL